MDFDTFKEKVEAIRVGKVLINPKKGTSTIKSYDNNSISYIRGKSTYRVSFRGLFDAYNSFKGKKVSSNDLRLHAPSIYNRGNGGHDCHCTFLFMVLKCIGVVDVIHGSGANGSPFFVNIPNEAKDACDEV